MAITLDSLLGEHREELVDGIVKDAIRQIPAYRAAPLRLTIDRVDLWLTTLTASLVQNDPKILAGYLVAVARERREEGYAIGELHTVVQITEEHLLDLIVANGLEPVRCNALRALLEAVMGAVRMTLSVAYLMSTQRHRDAIM